MLDVTIADGQGSGKAAKVSSLGELVTVPYDYDDVVSKTLGTADTAVNFFVGKSGQNLIITGIFMFANKNVGVNDATVSIYEASASGTAAASASKTLINTEMLKQSARAFSGLNLKVTEGKFVNGETNDDDVFVSIMGHFVPAI